MIGMLDEHLGTVLIVEDDAELRFILNAHLRAAGYVVEEAMDGAEAVGKAIELQPAMVIMDIGLPVLDGIAATKAIKADSRSTHIPVIILTARSGSQDVVRGLEAGAQEYLAKPFEVAELLARVQSVHKLACARRDLNRLNTKLEGEVDEKAKTLRILYEFMRDLSKADSRDRVLDLLMRCVEQTSRARRVSLFLVDASGEQLVCHRAIGIDRALVESIPMDSVSGVTDQVLRTGTALAGHTIGSSMDTERDYRQQGFVSVPLGSASLATRDGILGILNVTEKDRANTFTDSEIDCIRSIADAASTALDRLIRRERMRESVRVLLETVGRLAEYRDEETTLHMERVSRFSQTLAKEVQREGRYAGLVPDDWIELLVQAAPMHDIGKVGIPDEILTKPGRLTEKEFEVMKTHTEIGRRVLSRALEPGCPNPLLKMCVDIAYSHHERFDGGGYPCGLVGQSIPLAARIIALVDAYDAITSRRRYKEAQEHDQAVKIIMSESGKHFDPILVEAFARCADQFNEVRIRYAEEPELVDVAMNRCGSLPL
jgi:response regulator RpfG family c-di-GMP phosphodiesterase